MVQSTMTTPPGHPETPVTGPVTISIITGSTGNALLSKNLESVNALDVPEGVRVTHAIVVDGPQYEAATRALVAANPPAGRIQRQVIVLPENTGGDGYLCHRIIAAMSFLTNSTYMCVLDEDNEVEPCHVISHLNAIGPFRWSFTLRSIIDGDSVVQCEDTCESMGNIRPTVLSPADRLIDTNCYMFRADLARELAPLWMVRARQPNAMEADRRICQTLLTHEPKGGSTRAFTVRYRAAVRQGSGGSVSLDFFERGNARSLPWSPERRDVYLFHFDVEQTERVLGKEAKDPLGEWCMTMYDDLGQDINWINGYACLHALPYDAICFVAMCHPSTVPLARLRGLRNETHPDLKVILATLEGPNIRHRAQWSSAWLRTHADVVMTYSRPILEDEHIRTVFWPHNARFLSAAHLQQGILRENRGPGTGTVAMVLENRDTRGEYEVGGETAWSLDYMRREMARGFGPALTVVGRGWSAFCDEERDQGRPVPTMGYDMPRHMDPKTPVDTYQDHDVALIVENCGGPGAAGYVSEKVGDALIAGAIPLYWGENVPPGSLLDQGRGVWWIDLRDVLGGADQPAADEQPLGARIRAFLEARSPDEIQTMKDEVKRRREAYLLGVGTRAFATGLLEAISLVD